MLIFRIGVGNHLTPVLTVDKVINHARLQRTRSEQRHQCDDIFKTVGLKTLDQVLHAARFELEYGSGLCRLEQAVNGLVVERYGVNVEPTLTFACAGLINHFDRPIDDGEGTQTKEVEFDQARIFDIVLIVLRDQPATAFITIKR